MLFQSRVLHVAKDLGYADEYEDAFCVSDEKGMVAVADGVSSAVFSGQWSRIVTQSLVRQPPDLHDAEAFRQWLKEVRSVWSAQIDFPSLPANLQAKLRKVGGAFCTLLWLNLHPEDDSTNGRFRFAAFALGDTSLFHVRAGALLTAFPLTNAAAFDADPMSLCSVDWNRDQNLEFRSLEAACEAGDLLVLATDAVAKWILETLEREGAIDWNSFWHLDESAWIADIEAMRADHRIKRDDSTLVLLSVGQSPPAAAVAEPEVALSAVAVSEAAVAVQDAGESEPDLGRPAAEPWNDAVTGTNARPEERPEIVEDVVLSGESEGPSHGTEPVESVT